MPSMPLSYRCTYMSQKYTWQIDHIILYYLENTQNVRLTALISFYNQKGKYFEKILHE